MDGTSVCYEHLYDAVFAVLNGALSGPQHRPGVVTTDMLHGTHMVLELPVLMS